MWPRSIQCSSTSRISWRPRRGGDKTYALLWEALAKVVLRTREHLAALKAFGKALVLELMHFPDELADPNQPALPSGPSKANEMEMAGSLV